MCLVLLSNFHLSLINRSFYLYVIISETHQCFFFSPNLFLFFPSFSPLLLHIFSLLLHVLPSCYFFFFSSITPYLPPVSICLLPLLPLQEFRQKVMLGTPFLVIWLVGFIANLDIDSWLIKGLMYAGVWVAVQFLSKYVSVT